MTRTQRVLFFLFASTAVGCQTPGQAVSEADLEVFAQWCEPVSVSCGPGQVIVEDVSGWTDRCHMPTTGGPGAVGRMFIPMTPTTCPPSHPRLFTAIGADDCRCY